MASQVKLVYSIHLRCRISPHRLTWNSCQVKLHFWHSRLTALDIEKLHTKRLKHKGCVEMIEKYGYLTIRIPENWCSCGFPIQNQPYPWVWEAVPNFETNPLWVSSIQTDTLTRKNIRVVRIQSSATQLVHCNLLVEKRSNLFLLVKVISTVFQGNIHIWTPSLYGFTWSLSRGAIHDTRSQDAPLVLLPGVLPKISRFVPKKLSLHWSVIASARGFHRIFRYIIPV